MSLGSSLPSAEGDVGGDVARGWAPWSVSQVGFPLLEKLSRFSACASGLPFSVSYWFFHPF